MYDFKVALSVAAYYIQQWFITCTDHIIAKCVLSYWDFKLFYLSRAPWQVGKQQEIEEAGHDPQMLAQHGILLDTDLHQDPSSRTESRENKKWEAIESCDLTRLYDLA